MSRFNGNSIENYDAWLAGKDRRIKENANISRRRKLEAEIEKDGPEFRAWLFGSEPPHIATLRQASQDEFERSEYEGYDDNQEHAGPARKAFTAAWQQWIKKYGPVPTFLTDALENWGGLTEKQLAFARKIFAERLAKAEGREAREAERRANAQPWTAGRQEITGVVQSARWECYSVNRWNTTTSLKGLVLLADGRKVWTTLPARLYDSIDSDKILETIKGSTVTIKVTVEVSKDDPTMAFGKRPA